MRHFNYFFVNGASLFGEVRKMAVAPGNKRVNATLDPQRQKKLEELCVSSNKSISELFCKWIDTAYVLELSWNKKIK